MARFVVLQLAHVAAGETDGGGEIALAETPLLPASLAQALTEGRGRVGHLCSLRPWHEPSRRAGAARLRSVGNACNSNADCASGLCVQEGRTRKICHCVSPSDCPPATDQCHVATCTAGVCGTAVNLNAPCTDGNACTTGDRCQANGTCGGTPVTCPAPDQCHIAGVCDSQTGVCSNPAKSDGTACNDGNACTSGETCQNGTCTGGTVVTCPAPSSDCFFAGSCQSDTGQCSAETYKGDGAQCGNGGVCANQACCTPDNATTCAGMCGRKTNNCGQSVNCTDGCPVDCSCPFGGFCRVSPSKATCCCTVEAQICADVNGRPNCQLPKP